MSNIWEEVEELISLPLGSTTVWLFANPDLASDVIGGGGDNIPSLSKFSPFIKKRFLVFNLSKRKISQAEFLFPPFPSKKQCSQPYTNLPLSKFH